MKKYRINNIKSALTVEEFVNLLDVPEEVKALFRVPRIKINGEWVPGTLSTEAFLQGKLRLSE